MSAVSCGFVLCFNMLDVPEDVRFGFAWTRVHNLHVNECGCFAHNGVPARSCEQINTKRLSRPLTSWQFLLASPLGSQPLADKRGRPTVTVHAQCFSTGGATCTSIARMHNELPLPADLAWPRTVYRLFGDGWTLSSEDFQAST